MRGQLAQGGTWAWVMVACACAAACGGRDGLRFDPRDPDRLPVPEPGARQPQPAGSPPPTADAGNMPRTPDAGRCRRSGEVIWEQEWPDRRPLHALAYGA